MNTTTSGSPRQVELVVRRRNLRRQAHSLSASELRIIDLAGTCLDANMSHRVIFVEDDGTEHVMKGRGLFGELRRVERPITAASSFGEVQAYVKSL